MDVKYSYIDKLAYISKKHKYMTNTFKEQIKEDINLLKEKLAWDSQIGKDEYTFNYWVLSNLYSLDEECRYPDL